ncbi:hypothetical protein BBJ28_00017526 [Nothophytophthora sp. Chile5]|nr:hypothetical protein BBJ28_00017526 [Nothophytophthora sp. Chile5]
MENYNIYDEIGRGTHSFVYKARRKRSIEYVAVKSTAKSRMDKVLNEVPFLHKLDSPYVLKFFDWYESSNHIWLILEYCIGGDLLNLITQDKQLPESVVQLFRQLPRKRLQFDGLFDRDGKPGGGLRKISKLIYTAADCHVKSIIRNDAVQLGALPPVDSELLRFGVMTPEELLSCSTEALEDQLKEIYISLKSSTAEEPEKRSVIAYLFSLCRHSKLANVIVNSSILKLLIRMLAQQTRSNASSVATAQNPMLPMLCLVLGMLFRFATFIAPSSPDQLQGLVTTLMGIVHGRFSDLDEESAVVSGGLESRPLALACLGELVFYISTQQEWELPMKGVECVLSCVEAPHIVMRYYAVQTLGNMLVHCTDLLLPRLMSEQIVVALLRGLVQCATADFDDHVDSEESGMNLALRTTITETLAQVLRHLRSPTSAASLPLKLKRSIMLFFAKPEILTAVWRGVQSTPEFFDVAVTSLNIVNAFLEMKIVSDREAEQTAIKASRTLLLERVVTFPAIGRILEIKTARDGEDSETSETATLLRAKALLLLHLGVQLNRSFLLSFIQNQFLDLVEQILVPFSSHLQSSAGDTESSAPRVQLPAMEMYLAQCALNLCKLTIRMALKLGADCFSSHEDTGDQDHTGDTDSLTRRRPPQIASASFELFHGLLANPTCQLQFVHYFVANESNQYTFFLRLMAKLLTTFPNERLNLSRGSTTTTVALYVSEILLDLFQFAATEANAIVFVEKEMLFTLLLPAVVEHVLPSRDEADAAEEREDLAASSMRILYTVLLDFDYTMNESDVGKEDEDFRGTFIRLHLLPCFKSMLSGAEAVDESAWRFASEFLVGLLSSDSSLLQETEELQLAPIIVGLLNLPGDLGFRSLPPSVTRLVKMLVDREDVPMGLLYEAHIAGSLLSSLAFIVQKESWVSSLTDLLAILLHLLHARYESMRQSEESLAAPPGFDKLADCSPLMIQLCAAHAHEGDLQEQPEELSPGKSSPVSTEIREGAQMTREVVDLASRCLVFLSQHVIDAITGFASHRRPSGRGSGLTPTRLAHGTTSVSEQITKTAAGIMRLCRAADSSRLSSS